MVRENIGVEMIKPSSPTPPHRKNLRLSFLDQLAPPTYTHIILYFEANNNNCHEGSGETSRKLKRSLSDVLALYYPLAGRIRPEESCVDCNDAGAEYSEARFSEDRISDVVENPVVEELVKYVPAAPYGGGDVPLAVQVSFFGCKGVAVGVCMSHRVADAMSLVTFVNAWAAVCRRDAKTVDFIEPTFDLATRFPPADFSRFFPPEAPSPPPAAAENIVTKRLIFDEQKLAALKKAAAGPEVEKPTRVEAVSAFIWKHLIGASVAAAAEGGKNKSGGKNRAFAAIHAVDIRSRANPPLPNQVFGNACARSMAMTTAAAEEERDYSYYDVVLKLREAIRKADGDYIGKLENGDEFLENYSSTEENDPAFKDGSKTLEICCFTSWCRMPAYEADYGWGKPVWVSIIGVPTRKNLIFFMGSKSGDGIEAWLNMAEEDADVIQTNYNLLFRHRDVIAGAVPEM
ncbi:hypothetical protein ACP275_08G207500 [Erythranthe tilingii]